MPHATQENVTRFLEPLNKAMQRYHINTFPRIAAFLAQIAHESGSLKYVKELANGDAYDTRTDLGNTPQLDGDGRLYKGRGLIQITGVFNYRAVSKELSFDFIKEPQKLELPNPAAFSAAWFWYKKGLNELADADKFEAISIKINGKNKKTGTANGMPDRLKHWTTCKAVFNLS